MKTERDGMTGECLGKKPMVFGRSEVYGQTANSGRQRSHNAPIFANERLRQALPADVELTIFEV